MPAPALAAFALTAALACGAAAFAARLLGAGPLAAGLLVGGVALGYGACGVAVAHHAQRRADREADELDELTRRLSGSTSEAQARRLLLRYVHAVAPDAGAVLLSPADSSAADGSRELELTFGERILDTPLRGLEGVRTAPAGCRAIALGSAHEVRRATHGDGSEANIECAFCGQLDGELACEPLRCAGGGAGALLVSSARINSTARALIREAARRAAPVLDVRRQQAAAERRAGSDPLTALPNRPAAEQTLRRLCAQAGRTITPLAAVLLGLDRPPRRRAEREQAIALVGRRLTTAARASDFIARYDAHTFLVLAPDTDREGGLELAEKLRRALELLDGDAASRLGAGVEDGLGAGAEGGLGAGAEGRLGAGAEGRRDGDPEGRIAGDTQGGLDERADGRLTASLGVAALPMDALAPEDLLRQADRALQVARALGGNRVQAAESTLAP